MNSIKKLKTSSICSKLISYIRKKNNQIENFSICTITIENTLLTTCKFGHRQINAYLLAKMIHVKNVQYNVIFFEIMDK